LLTYWRFTLAAFVSLLLVTFTNLVNPQILRLVIDHGISARNLAAILSGSLELLALAGLRDLFTFTQSYWSERASQGADGSTHDARDQRRGHHAYLQREWRSATAQRHHHACW
jgi:ABC-type multidrug transport system fused ATPase/permease subunit